MSLFAYLNGSDVGSKVRLGAIGLQNQADGSVGFGSIIFDDSAASLTVRGWMSVKVVETACTDAPVLYYGYIGPRTYSRNGAAQYRLTSARFIDTTLVDVNARLHHRLITGSDGKRPAEDHNERIDWLLGSAYLSGLVDDFGLVDRSHPRPFEEADYRGQYADDVLSDLAGPIFKIFFAYWDQTEEAVGLFFDEPTTATNTSTLTISNVLSDITITGGAISGTCYPPFIDASLSRDPSEVYSRVRYVYKNGVVIESDTDTLADFFDDNDLGHRGLAIDNPRVGVEASARIMADGILERSAEENDTITVKIQLPPSQVGLIDAGQRIGVRFSHLPGYETQEFTRVTSRLIEQTEGTNELYDVTLELNRHGLSSFGGGGSGGFPLPPPATPSIVQSVSGRGNLHMPAALTAGNTMVYMAGFRSGAHSADWTSALGVPIQSWTAVQAETTFSGGYQVGSYYKLALTGESQYLGGSSLVLVPNNGAYGTWYELDGEWTPDTFDGDAGTGTLLASSGPIAAGAPSINLAVVGFGLNDGAYDSAANSGSFSFTPGTGWTEDGDGHTTSGGPSVWTGHEILTVAASITGEATHSSVGAFYRNWAAQVVSFNSTSFATQNPPLPGQEVPWEVVTMTGAEGTTTFPYATGSLEVKVDGVLISRASYTETDPACGDFTLSWITDTSEVVTVHYIGI